jgi:hypothetical protein
LSHILHFHFRVQVCQPAIRETKSLSINVLESVGHASIFKENRQYLRIGAVLQNLQDHFIVQQQAGQLRVAMRLGRKVGDAFESIL